MPVPGMAVIKCARTLCRVAAEQELIIAAGQRAQYRLHNRIGNTEASSTMNSILSSWNPCMCLWLCCRPRRGKPPLLFSRHVNISVFVHFRIFRNSGERLIHLSNSLHNTSWSCCLVGAVATTSGVRETRQEPKQRCRPQAPVFPTPALILCLLSDCPPNP